MYADDTDFEAIAEARAEARADAAMDQAENAFDAYLDRIAEPSL